MNSNCDFCQIEGAWKYYKNAEQTICPICLKLLEFFGTLGSPSRSPPITGETKISDLIEDSLDLVEFVMEFEESFAEKSGSGLSIHEKELLNDTHLTLGELSRKIRDLEIDN